MSEPLSRRDDPQTSKDAAVNARKFAANHSVLVMGALGTAGSAYDVARRTGLTAVQVDRRVSELLERGLIKVIEGETRPSPTGNSCRVLIQTAETERCAAKQPELFA